MKRHGDGLAGHGRLQLCDRSLWLCRFAADAVSIATCGKRHAPVIATLTCSLSEMRSRPKRAARMYRSFPLQSPHSTGDPAWESTCPPANFSLCAQPRRRFTRHDDAGPSDHQFRACRIRSHPRRARDRIIGNEPTAVLGFRRTVLRIAGSIEYPLARRLRLPAGDRHPRSQRSAAARAGAAVHGRVRRRHDRARVQCTRGLPQRHGHGRGRRPFHPGHRRQQLHGPRLLADVAGADLPHLLARQRLSGAHRAAARGESLAAPGTGSPIPPCAGCGSSCATTSRPISAPLRNASPTCRYSARRRNSPTTSRNGGRHPMHRRQTGTSMPPPPCRPRARHSTSHAIAGSPTPT